MCKQNKKLKQRNYDVYTKIQNPNKNNKRNKKHHFQQRKHQKNRNTELLLEELYIINRIHIESQHKKNKLERANKELSIQVLKVNVSVKEPNLREKPNSESATDSIYKDVFKQDSNRIQSTKETNVTRSSAKGAETSNPQAEGESMKIADGEDLQTELAAESRFRLKSHA